MNAVSRFAIGGIARPVHALHLLSFGLAVQCVVFSPANANANASASASANAAANAKPTPNIVRVNMAEWTVALTPSAVPAGPVVFEVTNSGKVPHALEIEGRGVEKSTSGIMPGASATLSMDLGAGTYEAYCPVGKGSHKMLGMTTQLTVGGTTPAPVANGVAKANGEKQAEAETHADSDAEKAEYAEHERGETQSEMQSEMHEMHTASNGHEAGGGSGPKLMNVVGGGPVIQILPGPFPFVDSAMAVVRGRPADQQADLTKKALMGPYSNNVANITGNISILAIDRGASGDSVSGVAEFRTQDGARWKVVMDRVQTKDIPFNPRFGGVIMGLFYHGASGVHTPLVPTIQSSLALWAFAHLYKNDQLVTDNAMVHVMYLSRTRRTSDWALDCWDCSNRPIEELQLQVTSAPNAPAFDAPGGFLFVNWEKSSGKAGAL